MSSTIISRSGSAMCFFCCCNNFFKSVSLLQLVLLLLVNPAHQQPGTPVIGGVCSLDTPDVHIGGKQTQFYLRCEPSTDSAPGEGVWVVKSRRAGSTASKIPAATIVSQHENVHGEQQQHTRKMAQKGGVISSYVCDLVADAVEHGYCSTSENCLQPVYTDRTAFLQCDPTTRRWVKKHCQSGFNFDFERQACIAHTAKMSHHFRQFPKRTADVPNSQRAIVCTYAQCSVLEPCNVGSCNNAYCCSAAIGSVPKASALPRTPSLSNLEVRNKTAASSSTSSTTRPPAAIVPPPIPSILVIELNNNNNNDGADALLHVAQQQQLFNDDDVTSSVLLRPIGRHSNPLPAAQIDHCSSGFHSPIRCGGGGSGTHSDECPVGLICESATRFCCPFPPKQQLKKRKTAAVALPAAQWPRALSLSANDAKGNRRRMALRRHDRFGRKRFCAFCCTRPAQLLIGANANGQIMGGTNAIPSDQQLNMLICPTGAPALGPCAPGFCVAPMQCAGALCCAPPAVVPPPPPPVAYGCPGGLPALGPCIGGRCASPGTLCASPSNVCCAQSVPTAIPATVCPDGTQAAGACVNGQCGAGFTCNQGLCCTNSSQTPRCLDGSQSIGACIQGKCGTGYTCTTGNICCPSQLNLCPPGQTSVGQAVNGRCPAGYTNFNGQCCGAQSAQSQISCSVEDSFGRCDNNQQCAEPGYACDVANNWCCPQVIGDAIGPCIQGEGGNRLCPEGYACVGEGEGQCFRLDTGTCAPEEQSGPCAPDGSCPPGYECIEGFCCQTDVGAPAPTAALRFRQRRRRAVAPATAFLGMVRRSN
uniref:Chitin-binding type-2 domain-containing protein n=1 Tax=Globodera rostochiensis TaxID=31243 RepID=A0A914GNY7_GLORO